MDDGGIWAAPVGTPLESFFERAHPEMIPTKRKNGADDGQTIVAAVVNGTLRELTRSVKHDVAVQRGAHVVRSLQPQVGLEPAVGVQIDGQPDLGGVVGVGLQLDRRGSRPPDGVASEDASRGDATITEMIFVPDEVADGIYALSLQVAPFVADAAPSRPLLFALDPA